MCDSVFMNGNELLKKIRKLAKRKNKYLMLFKAHGKGSHSTLKYLITTKAQVIEKK